MEVTNRGTQVVTLTCDFPVKWMKKNSKTAYPLVARSIRHSTLRVTQ